MAGENENGRPAYVQSRFNRLNRVGSALSPGIYSQPSFLGTFSFSTFASQTSAACRAPKGASRLRL